MAALAMRRTRQADLAFVTALERHADHVELIGQWSDQEHRAAIGGTTAREHWIIELDSVPAGYLIAYDGRPRARSLYIKRILLAEKGLGTGSAALTHYLDEAFARDGIDYVWLRVRESNLRAQAVYRRLGFERYDPPPAEAAELAAYAEAPAPGSFSMRLTLSAWRRSRAK
jgi:ribosomal protein S18 acetylase RimI-like enzyme